MEAKGDEAPQAVCALPLRAGVGGAGAGTAAAEADQLFPCRDKDAAEAFERERAETLRRRALTAEERAREDAELEKQGLKVFKKEKEQMGFLQKYHHRGAFYMDDSSIQEPNDVRRRCGRAPLPWRLCPREAQPLSPLQIGHGGNGPGQVRQEGHAARDAGEGLWAALPDQVDPPQRGRHHDKGPPVAQGRAVRGCPDPRVRLPRRDCAQKHTPPRSLRDKEMRKRAGMKSDLDTAGRVVRRKR